jgi:hypothetical protein
MDCFEVRRIQPDRITAAPSSSSQSDNIQNRGNQNNGSAKDNGNEESVSKAVPLTAPEEFLCLDFTVDLDIACDKRGKSRLFGTVQCITAQHSRHLTAGVSPLVSCVDTMQLLREILSTVPPHSLLLLPFSPPCPSF